jgi:hypothetical protein
MPFLSCFWSDIVVNALKKRIIVLESDRKKLHDVIDMQEKELNKFKRSPYFFLGNPVNEISQRVLI